MNRFGTKASPLEARAEEILALYRKEGFAESVVRREPPVRLLIYQIKKKDRKDFRVVAYIHEGRVFYRAEAR